MYFSLFLLLPLSHSGSGGDYTSHKSIDLTLNSGTTSQMVTVATSTDTAIENEETFTLTLTENDDAVDVMPQSATVTITDETSKYIHCHIKSMLQPGGILSTVSSLQL